MMGPSATQSRDAGDASGGVQDRVTTAPPEAPIRKIHPPVPGKPVGKNSISRLPGALSIVYRPLASLNPYARNARTHSPAQIVKLRASLSRYGWTNPILIAGDDIIAGHARHAASSAMAQDGDLIPRNPDPMSAPTIDLSALSPAERRAYIIADNRLAEDAGWDMDMLRLEFADLPSLGIDLSLTGFDVTEIADILTPAGDTSPAERDLTAAEDDALDVAWRRAIDEWSSIIASSDQRPYVTTTYTKGVLAVLYLRSLYLGDEFPRGATLAYTPHRHATIGDKGSISDALAAALGPDGRTVRNSIRWASAQKPSLDKLIGAMTLPIHGRRLPGDFPALLARDLIDEFAPRAASVLDPCHGWGGRLIGFLLSAAVRYTGYDPSPETHTGVQSMFDDLVSLTPERRKAATLIEMPFEKARLKPASFDFALTSPPYFDTEKYAGAASSWRLYSTYADWLTGFYEPLIASVARALKPDAVFCLQVGSQQYPLKDDAIRLAPSHSFVHVETRHTHMINNRAKTDPDDGEVIVVLRRR